jgi:hypothetical protein
MGGLFGEIVLGAWSHTQTDIPFEYKSVVFFANFSCRLHVPPVFIQWSSLVQYGRELAKVVSIDAFFAADGFGAGIATRV